VDVKKIVMALALVPIAGFLIWDHKQTQIEARNAEMRGAMLDYLSQPQFSGRDFLKQLTGVDGRFQMYDLDEEMIYISVPEKKFHDGETLGKLTRHPEAVEFAKTVFEEQRLGDLRLDDLSQKFFRMPARTFRVDGDSTVETSYKDGIRYRATVAELTEYLHERSTFSGPDRLKSLDGRRPWNHGAFVSRPEPSLTRFVRPMRKHSQDETAQSLLSFVTDDISYDILETLEDAQVLKRAPEVLLTKQGTCSGKTILFASLLEQVSADYLLAYMPGDRDHAGHIAVLVRGNFPNENGYQVTVFGKKYQYAETTTPGFRIGRTMLADPKNPKQPYDPTKRIRFVQQPGGSAFDIASGAPLRFVN
jgi:hypothetical protein